MHVLLAVCSALLHSGEFAAVASPARRSRLAHASAVSEQGVLVAPAELTDVPSVVELTMRTFFGELGSDYGFNNCRATAFFELEAEQQASLRDGLLRAQAFKATDGSRIIGFVACGVDGALTNLAVEPSYRRAGVGRRLVEKVLASAPSARVTLEVDGDNAPALALYRSCGFAVSGEREGTRYRVDWWRGRVVEKGVAKVLMEADRTEEGAVPSRP
jgi:ribosomal protein S18 acetylase RimI-like enzyme